MCDPKRLTSMLDFHKPEHTVEQEQYLKAYAEKLAIAAATFFANDRFRNALNLLTEAICTYPSPQLYCKRSVLHLSLQQYIAAAADATSALGLDTSFPSSRFCRALAFVHLKHYEAALKELKKLRNLLPNSKLCCELYTKNRDTYRETGSFPPFAYTPDISKDPVADETSVFNAERLFRIDGEATAYSQFEASVKITEDYTKKLIQDYTLRRTHLHGKFVIVILKQVRDIFKCSSNVEAIRMHPFQTLTVVGDLLGKFENLQSIFEETGFPAFGKPYVFNGNMIGPSQTSLEVILILFCMKIVFPDEVFIARGSEECAESTELNGFDQLVRTIYDDDVLMGFYEVFNLLPLCHLYNDSILILHGGLFSDPKINLAAIQALDRNVQPPLEGPITDILYSEPSPLNGYSATSTYKGISFGPDVTSAFCAQNHLDLIIRSHGCDTPEGYEMQLGDKCVTIISSTSGAPVLKIEKYSTFQIEFTKSLYGELSETITLAL